MIDRSLLRRLRVTALGILGAIVSIEFLRAAVAWYIHTQAHSVAVSFSAIFSLIVLVVVAVLVVAVLLPAQRAVFENMRGAEVARESLERSEAWYRSIFDHHPNPAVAIDRNGNYLRVNAAMEKLSGYRESELIGLEARMAADEHVPVVRAALRAAEEGKPSQFEIEFVRKDGGRRTISVDAIPMRSGGLVAGMYAFSRDVTDARHAMAREALQRERFRAIALLAARDSSSADRIAETLEFATKTLEMDACHVGIVHEGTLVVTGGSGSPYPSGVEIPLARSFSRHVLGSHDVLVIEDVAREPWASDPAHAWQPWAAYVCISISAGADRVGALSFVKNRPLERFDDADRDFVVVIAALIGAHLQREREERELARLAFVDALTGLPNRAYFSEQIDLAIAQARRDDTSFAVQYVDLDGFKTVNDLQGHDAGDHVLAVIAARLKMAARLSDVVARYGGDEFVVLQRRYEGNEGAAHLAQRLINAAAEPIIIRDEIVRLGASVGIACYPRDAQTAEELLRCADAAMYRAKHAGRNRLELYG